MTVPDNVWLLDDSSFSENVSQTQGYLCFSEISTSIQKVTEDEPENVSYLEPIRFTNIIHR